MAKERQPIHGMKLGPIICKAIGIESSQVYRVILDCRADAAAMVYIEMYASEQMLELDWAKGLKGADITIVETVVEAEV